MEGYFSYSQLAKICGMNKRTVEKRVEEMIADGSYYDAFIKPKRAVLVKYERFMDYLVRRASE